MYIELCLSQHCEMWGAFSLASYYLLFRIDCNVVLVTFLHYKCHLTEHHRMPIVSRFIRYRPMSIPPFIQQLNVTNCVSVESLLRNTCWLGYKVLLSSRGLNMLVTMDFSITLDTMELRETER